MDNIAHTLIGAGLANAGLKRRWGAGTTAALMLSSNLPDIDALWLFHPGESFMYRRMLTHGVIGIPLVALLGALIIKAFYRRQSLKTLFGLCLLGVVGHVFFDMVNTYGVVLLYPFSMRRYELGWVFIVDLAIWAMMATPFILIAYRPWRGRLEPFSRWAMTALALYVLFCGAAKFRSEALFKRWIRDEGIKPSLFAIFPEALGPHRFRAAIREFRTYHVVMAYPLTGKTKLIETVPTVDNEARAAGILELDQAKKLEWFFAAPVWTRAIQKPDLKLRWQVYDLRFRSAVINRKPPFLHTYRTSGDGKVEILGWRNNEELEGPLWMEENAGK